MRSAESAPGELESRLHIIKQEILSRDRLAGADQPLQSLSEADDSTAPSTMR